MKLQLISDVHLEFHRDYGEAFIASLDSVGVDALVIAGDLYLFRHLSDKWVFDRLCKKYGQVFYVPGNHEYYRSSPTQTDNLLRQFETDLPGLTVLRTGSVHSFMGRRILGDTMWFPYCADVPRYKHELTDYKLIKEFTPWVYTQNTEFRKFLERELQLDDIVVTHHLPARSCIHSDYAGDPFNCFFLSDQEDLIRERKPAVWMFGHTHTGTDHVVGSTRLVCNPLGYPNEPSVGTFNDKLIIEV